MTIKRIFRSMPLLGAAVLAQLLAVPATARAQDEAVPTVVEGS
jgi:hypothetical protein